MTTPHRPSTMTPRQRRRVRATDVADRAGAFVTLVAIVVLGLMIGSALPGGTAGDATSTVTVTYDP